MHEVSETELIRRARAGESRAMRALHERYAPLVFAVVRRFAPDDDTAHDWEQDAWISAFRGLHDYRGNATLGSWLHRIAVNAALQGQRRTHRHTNGHEDMEAAEDVSMVASAESERILLRLDLTEAINRLPSRMREILLLHDVEGFQHEEIATLLDITDGASRSQLFKARARLRRLMGGDEHPNGAHR